MTSEDPILVISPVGHLDVDRDFLQDLGREIHHVFGYPADIQPLMDEKDLWIDPVRKQCHSTPILDTIALLSPPWAVKVLAITKIDLFIPILTHVYGEAQLGGKACILSTYRFSEGLAPGSEIFRDRLLKEAVHELGHTFRLRHCEEASCVMHYCRGIREVDRKTSRFCRYCAVLLKDETKKQAQEEGEVRRNNRIR